jgi:hypothetical protein
VGRKGRWLRSLLSLVKWRRKPGRNAPILSPVTSQQVEREVNLAAGRVAAGVAVSGKLLCIALGRPQRSGVLDDDPPEGGFVGNRPGSARTMAADM